MEVLQDALNKALLNNAEETSRWTKFEEENVQAIENLEAFRKKLEIDIMVPLGSKALIPGKLYHTNEILVSHYQGIFSKCPSSQAQDICRIRLKQAQDHLKSLETEREMYQNRLRVPFADGALPGQGEHEITEEYDEEKEAAWREEHQRRVREQKQRERNERLRAQQENTHEEVMSNLEELELMDELERELDELQVNDDDTLNKLISGEISLPPEKKRTAHENRHSSLVLGISKDIKPPEVRAIPSVVDEVINKYRNLDLSTENDLSCSFTNNNTLVNVEDFNRSSENDSDDSSDSLPDEVKRIEKSVEELPSNEKVSYLRGVVKEIDGFLQNFSVRSLDDLNVKVSKLETREFVLDYMEIITDEIKEAELITKNLLLQQQVEVEVDEAKPKKQKRKISFASEDQIKIIDRSEATIAVSSSLTFNNNALKPEMNEPLMSPVLEDSIDRKKVILDKVAKSWEFVSENQSQRDFDLVGKILGSEADVGEILKIEFKHSEKVFKYPGYTVEGEDVICSPADIYKKFKNYFPLDRQPNVMEFETVENSVRQQNHEKAYEDPKIKFCNVSNVEINDSTATKSILKNKQAVNGEVHKQLENQTSKKKKKRKPEVEHSGFDMIMGDVVEKLSEPITEPDPLPSEQFIDTHAPKKRISRFKQMRSVRN